MFSLTYRPYSLMHLSVSDKGLFITEKDGYQMERINTDFKENTTYTCLDELSVKHTIIHVSVPDLSRLPCYMYNDDKYSNNRRLRLSYYV